MQNTERKIPLTKSQLEFVLYYIAQDFTNASRAYKKAYPKSKMSTARVEASRLLTRPNIQEAIATELQKILAEARVPLEKRILKYWTTRAFYDATQIVGLDGKVVIDEKQLRRRGLDAVIDGVNEKLNAQGMRYLEIKLANRDKALEMLQQYIGMIDAGKRTDNANNGSIEKDRSLLEQLVADGEPQA